MSDFQQGDATGLPMPVHGDALLEAGPEFLTRAFRCFGTLSTDNRVSRIVAAEPCVGGSTGRKLYLSVEYAQPATALERDLFVKFSRALDDPVRDEGRYEMESEVRLAALSRHPAFPIRVPTTYFADYHAPTGSGLLITGRVPFGRDGIEPQAQKCSDHLLADPLDHYRAVLAALARLAAAHRSGRLAREVEAAFPFDGIAAVAADPIPWSEEQLGSLVADYAGFATRCPRLLPAEVRTPDFLARFETEALAVLRREAEIKRFLHADPDYIALCHWNAQLDNAWFWRDGAGQLQCGLIDWGRVRQMNLAYALWGCLVGADLTVWEHHLDELLAFFIAELEANGGPRLALGRLKLHLQLYAATIGLAGIMIAPQRILLQLPEAASASGPRDPVFEGNEEARCFLHILTIFLSLWRASDVEQNLTAVSSGLSADHRAFAQE